MSIKPLSLRFVAPAILLSQLFVVPGLSDLSSAGKLYLLFIFVLGATCWWTLSADEVKVPPVAFIFGALCLIFSLSAYQALEPLWAMVQVSILLIFVVLLVLISTLSANQPTFIDCWIDALLVCGVVMAGLGLYEYMFFILNGPTRGALIPYLLPANVGIRIGGPYGQPNQFALFLSVSLLAFFYRYVHGSLSHASSFSRSLRLAPFFLISVVFFMTLSRSGLLSVSLLFAFLVWLVVSGRYLADDPEKKREFFTLLLCLAASFLAIKGLAWVGGEGSPRLTWVRSLGDTGINPAGRYVFWTSALLIFLDHPWLGVGLDHYKNVMNGYGPQSHELLGFVPFEAMKSTNWAHNELLQVLCEGGGFAFVLVLLLLGLLLYKIWVNFVSKKKVSDPIFLYSHIFLLPFVVQSMFSWPLRSPPLLILFFACVGVLVSRYPSAVFSLTALRKKYILFFALCALYITATLFYQEIKIGVFKSEFIETNAGANTLSDFSELVEHPYNTFRVLRGALPGYLREAFRRDDVAMFKYILPYYERLSMLEGARWQWYDLSRIYLQINREEDAREAILRAVDLMPLDQRSNGFLHYLNILRAARETGRPVDDFWPLGEKVDFSKLESLND